MRIYQGQTCGTGMLVWVRVRHGIRLLASWEWGIRTNRRSDMDRGEAALLNGVGAGHSGMGNKECGMGNTEWGYGYGNRHEGTPRRDEGPYSVFLIPYSPFPGGQHQMQTNSII
jgi:hypothetical protein